MRSKDTPVEPALQLSTVAYDGPRAFPVLEAFDRIGVQSTKGYALVNSGDLETFLIGRNRYVTAEAIRDFLRRCIEKSLTESADQRAKKVAPGVAASLRSRAERAAA